MRVAAMDLGTNSFHLLVADAYPDGHIDPLVREKEMLRLGDVVSRYGSIPETAADQAVATVRRFRMLGAAAGADEIEARATSAIRRADNGDELVDRIEHETGVVVEVISGHEEARLIFGAVRAAVVLDPAPALCFDLGGGSLEVMVGDAAGLAFATSAPLGVARLSTELLHGDPLSKSDRRALRARLVEVLTPIAERVAALHPLMAVGSSGTIENLAAMVVARRDDEPPATLNQVAIGRDEFLDVHKELLTTRAAERLRYPGLDTRRVDLIVAGSTFLATAMELFDFDAITISEWALREGIVLDTVARHDPADWSGDPRAIRRSSVESLGRRCNWSEGHARHVARLATSLFDQTTSLHHIGSADRELLEFGSLLHDIGEHVASSGHHRHSAYLVRNGQLRGFSPLEIEMLAALVRWHRGSEPRVSDDFPLLDAPTVERLRTLAALLRVADGLDRGRDRAVRSVDAMITPSLVLLRLGGDDDIELEQWGARRKRALLEEKVVGRDVELTTHPASGRATA